MSNKKKARRRKVHHDDSSSMSGATTMPYSPRGVVGEMQPIKESPAATPTEDFKLRQSLDCPSTWDSQRLESWLQNALPQSTVDRLMESAQNKGEELLRIERDGLIRMKIKKKDLCLEHLNELREMERKLLEEENLRVGKAKMDEKYGAKKVKGPYDDWDDPDDDIDGPHTPEDGDKTFTKDVVEKTRNSIFRDRKRREEERRELESSRARLSERLYRWKRSTEKINDEWKGLEDHYNYMSLSQRKRADISRVNRGKKLLRKLVVEQYKRPGVKSNYMLEGYT